MIILCLCVRDSVITDVYPTENQALRLPSRFMAIERNPRMSRKNMKVDSDELQWPLGYSSPQNMTAPMISQMKLNSEMRQTTRNSR